MGKEKQSYKGHFLISNSTIQDPNFVQTVVLLIEHDKNGAFGLVVNRLENITLYDVVQGMSEKAQEIKLYEGGPVRPDALFVLHGFKNARNSGEEIIPDVFLGSNKELMIDLLENDYPFHIYHGYAGWVADQLENELESKTWITMPASKEIVFHQNPQVVWREALHHKGGIYGYFAKNVRNPFFN
ncbi:MAG: YqgE/AlgH family protein [Spirochaetia bacterium]|nr:YqgE/AlgH family protein [Spirochaetia bacterium]